MVGDGRSFKKDDNFFSLSLLHTFYVMLSSEFIALINTLIYQSDLNLAHYSGLRGGCAWQIKMGMRYVNVYFWRDSRDCGI